MRRLRFSLRTLVIGVLVCGSALLLGYRVHNWLVELEPFKRDVQFSCDSRSVFHHDGHSIWRDALDNSGRVLICRSDEPLICIKAAPEIDRVVAWKSEGADVYCISTGKLILSVKAPEVKLSPDSSKLVSYSPVCELARLWDCATGAVLPLRHKPCDHERSGVFHSAAPPEFCAVFSPGSGLIATCFGCDDVRVWDTEDGKQCLQWGLSEGVHRPDCLEYDGRKVAVSGRVFDARKGKALGVFNAEGMPRFTGDGKAIAFFDQGTQWVPFHLFDIDTGNMRYSIDLKSSDSLPMLPPGRDRLILRSGDGTVCGHDLSTGTLLFALKGHRQRVSAVAYCSDGHLIATAARGEAVRVWNASTGECLAVLDAPDDVTRPEFSPDDGYLAASGSTAGRVWCCHAWAGFWPVLKWPEAWVCIFLALALVVSSWRDRRLTADKRWISE